jgi:hypothetical protein
MPTKDLGVRHSSTVKAEGLVMHPVLLGSQSRFSIAHRGVAETALTQGLSLWPSNAGCCPKNEAEKVPTTVRAA